MSEKVLSRSEQTPDVGVPSNRPSTRGLHSADWDVVETSDEVKILEAPYKPRGRITPSPR